MFAFKSRAIYSNPEFQSAMVRLGIWVFAIIYVSAGAISGLYPLDLASFSALFALYLLFFSSLLISVFMRPVWEGRRYFSLVGDISATTICIYFTGEAASPFFLLYIWIFLSYGTRYGRRHLRAASILSVVAYSLVLTLLGQWEKYLFEAMFVLLVLGLLPIYQFSLMNRLHHARIQAEESNRLMGRFLSNMTNDMRAPLGDIITTSKGLMDRGLDMRQLDKVEEISSSASLLDAVIGDVLDLSKLETRQLQMQSVPFNLQDLLMEVCSVTSQCARTSKTELTCSISNEVPRLIVGDEQRLRQILINVVKNAMANSNSDELKVAVSVNGPSLLFEIDGMDQTAQDAGPESADASNIGSSPDLGISLAQKLTRALGGEFGSVKGEDGSVFWLSLPLVLNEFEQEQADRVSSLQGRKVFLFDTNSYSRGCITASCEAAGMIVESVDRVAALGDAISESREKHDIDVILISDPPGGVDVARVADICLGVLGQDLPLVVLAHRRSCIDLGQYDSATLIRKPFVLDSLVDAMDQVLATGDGYQLEQPAVDSAGVTIG
jgi:two-component system, sensor histidine kinase RpfC